MKVACWLVGAPVEGRMLLVDDVLTSGKAIRSAVELLEPTGATIVAAVIAMDRQEYLTPNPDQAPNQGPDEHE